MAEDKKALEKKGQEDAQTETPTVEEPTEEVPEVQEKAAAETLPFDTETEESSKKGAATRIRELNTQKKVAEEKATILEEKAKSLEEKLAELTSPVGDQGQMPQYDPQEPVIQPGEEVDANEFQKRVLAQADARTELRIRQSEATNRINNEAKDAVRKYPELDPESENFNKDLSDSVYEATEAHIRANPYTASVTNFVDKLMKPYKGAVAKEIGNATENIAKQVSGAALRPTSIRKEEKAASDKTIAELEQELGIVQT